MGERGQECIVITGARENNLKNVNLRIPKRKITIFTGVSGSGKSSIVFDTIAAESTRLLYENFSMFVRNFLPRVPQPDTDSIENLNMAVVVDQKRLGGGSHSTVGTVTDIAPLLRLLFSRIGEPHVGHVNMFSFNDPAGMCPECGGLGRKLGVDLNRALDMDKSLNEGAILLPDYSINGWDRKEHAHSSRFSRPTSGGDRHRPIGGRSFHPFQSRHLHGHPGRCAQGVRRGEQGQSGAFQLQFQGRMRKLPGAWRRIYGSCLPRQREAALRSVRRKAVQGRSAGVQAERQVHRGRSGDDGGAGAGIF
jgi:hypothetical protein